MARHTAYVGALTIASGAATSNTLTVSQGKLSVSFTIVGPAALTNAVAVRGALNDTDTPQALVDDKGTDVTVVVAKTRKWQVSGVKYLTAVSAANEGAARVTQVYCEFDL